MFVRTQEVELLELGPDLSLSKVLAMEIDFYFFRMENTITEAQDAARLTETDPRGELAEGRSVGVIAKGVEQFEADVDEGLQHCRPGSGAWLSPFRHPNSSVHVERAQRLLPVHWLHRQGEERRNVWQYVLRQELPATGTSIPTAKHEN